MNSEEAANNFPLCLGWVPRSPFSDLPSFSITFFFFCPRLGDLWQLVFRPGLTCSWLQPVRWFWSSRSSKLNIYRIDQDLPLIWPALLILTLVYYPKLPPSDHKFGIGKNRRNEGDSGPPSSPAPLEIVFPTRLQAAWGVNVSCFHHHDVPRVYIVPGTW